MLCTDLANVDANMLKYWLSKFVQEYAKSQGEMYQARTLYVIIICGIRRHLDETVVLVFDFGFFFCGFHLCFHWLSKLMHVTN